MYFTREWPKCDQKKSHLELPCWRGHLPLSALRECEHPQVVRLAGGEVVDGGLQLVADVDHGVVGLGYVPVGLPVPDLEPYQ